LLRLRWCWLTWVASIFCLAWESCWARPQIIEQALFQPEGQVEFEPVQLPHDWPSLADSRPLRRAIYQVHFDVGQVAPDSSHLWALSTRRVSTRYRISVGDQLLAVGETGHADQSPQHVHGLIVMIPPALLHAGVNTLTLEIDAEQGRGLARLEVGPRDEVVSDHDHYEALFSTLPQIANAGTIPFALVLIALWAFRRQEQAIGLFALAWLPTGLRNYGVYMATAPLGADAWRASVVLGRVGSAIFFALFAIAMSRERWPRLRHICLASLVMLTLFVIAAIWAGRLSAWRYYLYPLGIPFGVLAVGLLWIRARSEPVGLASAITLAALAVLTAGIHDELMVLGRLGIEAEEWLPWVSPVVFICVSLGLITRAARALGEVEALNAELEQRVTTRTIELVSANAEKSRFLAAASHDLRQPLHSITLLVALLSRRAATPDISTLAERLDASVSGMHSTLDALLDLSSLDAGAEVPKIEALAIGDLLARVAQDLRPDATERGLALRVHPSTLWVSSDATMLRRMVQNLVTNAIRYTPHGGVLLGARPRGDQVSIEVWDTGIGIAPEQHEAIFHEFVQLRNPGRDRSKGVGLGLSIVRRLASLLGAQIVLTSRPGHGSVFRLRLPRVTLNYAVSDPASAANRSDASGLFVVVIDDDEAVRFSMMALLSELGCRVVTAASSQEALTELTQHLRMPDAAIVDYRLGCETGHAATAALRRGIDEQLPVALITGDLVVPDYPHAGVPAPVIMRKPVEVRDLCAWLSQVKAAVAAKNVSSD
jgi:signal transduction histidine kinase/CheY-like chemotaxis protein